MSSSSFDRFAPVLSVITDALLQRPEPNQLTKYFLEVYPCDTVKNLLDQIPVADALECFIHNDEKCAFTLADDGILELLSEQVKVAAHTQQYWKMLGLYALTESKPNFTRFSNKGFLELLLQGTPGGVAAGVARLLLFYHAVEHKCPVRLDKLLSCVIHWYLGGKFVCPSLAPTRHGALMLLLGRPPVGGIIKHMEQQEHRIASYVVDAFAKHPDDIFNPNTRVSFSLEDVYRLSSLKPVDLRAEAIKRIASYIKEYLCGFDRPELHAQEDQQDQGASKRVKRS